MREILISLLMLGVIVGLDWLGLEGSGLYQFVGLLRFELDGVPVGGGVGGHVSLLAIVVGVFNADGMLFTWQGEGGQALTDKAGFWRRAMAGLAKVFGVVLIALAAAAALRYGWWLVVQMLR